MQRRNDQERKSNLEEVEMNASANFEMKNAKLAEIADVEVVILTE